MSSSSRTVTKPTEHGRGKEHRETPMEEETATSHVWTSGCEPTLEKRYVACSRTRATATVRENALLCFPDVTTTAASAKLTALREATGVDALQSPDETRSPTTEQNHSVQGSDFK